MLNNEPMRRVKSQDAVDPCARIPRLNNNHSLTHTGNTTKTQELILNARVSDDQAHHSSARQQTSQKTKQTNNIYN